PSAFSIQTFLRSAKQSGAKVREIIFLCVSGLCGGQKELVVLGHGSAIFALILRWSQKLAHYNQTLYTGYREEEMSNRLCFAALAAAFARAFPAPAALAAPPNDTVVMAWQLDGIITFDPGES